jgi:predicted nucleotidyltransferase
MRECNLPKIYEVRSMELTDELEKDEMDNKIWGNSYRRFCDNHIFLFPIIVNTDFVNINRIFPSKQKIVKSIYDNSDLHNLCKQIIVFGSSITLRCTMYSDLDLAVELLNDNNESRNKATLILSKLLRGSRYDLIWIDEDIYNERVYEYIQKGVKIL